MDDGSAPRPTALNADVNADFQLYAASDTNSWRNLTVTLVSGNLYRVSGRLALGAFVAGQQFGVVRRSTHSGKGFRVTGFQIAQAAAAETYLKTVGRAIPRYHRDNDQPRARQLPGTQYWEWLLEPGRTNKVFPAVPGLATDLALGGDAAATLTVVDDGTALAAAKLPGATVWKLDNSLGTTRAVVNWTQTPGNVNPHSLSVYVRGGTGFLRDANSDLNMVAFPASASYQRVKRENFAPAASAGYFCGITADPGQVVYFMGMQAEEAAFSSSLIITTTAAVQRVLDDADVAATLTAGDMLLATKSFTTNVWSYVWIAHPGGAYQVPNDNGVILLEYGGRTLTAAQKQAETDRLRAALIADGQQIDAGWV